MCCGLTVRLLLVISFTAALGTYYTVDGIVKLAYEENPGNLKFQTVYLQHESLIWGMLFLEALVLLICGIQDKFPFGIFLWCVIVLGDTGRTILNMVTASKAIKTLMSSPSQLDEFLPKTADDYDWFSDLRSYELRPLVINILLILIEFICTVIIFEHFCKCEEEALIVYSIATKKDIKSTAAKKKKAPAAKIVDTHYKQLPPPLPARVPINEELYMNQSVIGLIQKEANAANKTALAKYEEV